MKDVFPMPKDPLIAEAKRGELRALTAPVSDAPDNTPAYFLALARENAALREALANIKAAPNSRNHFLAQVEHLLSPPAQASAPDPYTQEETALANAWANTAGSRDDG
jgi:hypothetical protein